MAVDPFVYTKEAHAAVYTNDYVFHQLIPYLGNKRKLLPLIRRALERTGIAHPGALFLDLFAGSGVVARMAKRMGLRIIANDWEPYAHAINACYIGCNSAPAFAALGGYEAAIQHLNALPNREGWVTRHLCPRDDERIDPKQDRLFYTRANGLRLDAMREQIDEWYREGCIHAEDVACLLAPLLYTACYVSNTSGIFKGFHNGWGGQTGTALYRIRARAQLRPALFVDNGLSNAVHRRDAGELATALTGVAADIAYIDPPYNQHPYGSNYHVLNSITLWDCPALSERITKRDKAAIRADWRTDRRSAYNYRQEAAIAFAHLVSAIDARFLLTSYSTDGRIPLEALVATCVQRGHTEYVQQEYKRYRVSSQRFSHKPLTVEFVLITDTTRHHTGESVEAICAALRAAETVALQRHREGALPPGAAPLGEGGVS